MVFVAVLAGGLLSAGITGAVRSYALRHEVLDVPNERSSHTIPVPRGGGLAITTVVLGGTLILLLMGIVDVELAAAITRIEPGSSTQNSTGPSTRAATSA